MGLVSLILTTFNCKENLKKTLESIESQDYPDLEVVIKDGGSSDGTVEVIKKYEKTSRFTVKWVSMADGGLYDAMNQGLSLSTGAVILFFNDRFTGNDVVSKCVGLMEMEGTEGVHGDLVYAEDGVVKRYWKMGTGSIRSGWMPGHPTLFLKREVYERYGNYDSSYKCSGDFEFMVRILKDGKVRLSYIPEILVEMYYGGTSTQSTGAYRVSIQEAHRALASNGIRFAWWVVLLRTLRTVPQFFPGAGKCRQRGFKA